MLQNYILTKNDRRVFKHILLPVTENISPHGNEMKAIQLDQTY